MNFFSKFFFAFFFSGILSLARGWGPSGHLVIAQIAYSRLTKVAKANVKANLFGFSNTYPNFSKIPSAALWADILEHKSNQIFSHWHYIDYPVVVGIPSVKPKLPAEENIAWALYRFYKTLKDSNSDLWSKEFALRFLLHLVGEIHQPLNCANFYSKMFPKGNRGAKTAKLLASTDYDAKYLYDFWDNGAGLLDEIKIFGDLDQNLNLFEFSISDISNFIQDSNLESPVGNFTDSLIENKNFTHWAVESNTIAKKDVFHGSVLSTIDHIHFKLNQEYIENAQYLVKNQIALAGLRLASVLNHLFTELPSKSHYKRYNTSSDTEISNDSSLCSSSSTFFTSSLNAILIFFLASTCLLLFCLLLFIGRNQISNFKFSPLTPEVEISSANFAREKPSPDPRSDRKRNFQKLWNKHGSFATQYFTKIYNSVSRNKSSSGGYSMVAEPSSGFGGGLYELDDEDENFLGDDDQEESVGLVGKHKARS